MKTIIENNTIVYRIGSYEKGIVVRGRERFDNNGFEYLVKWNGTDSPVTMFDYELLLKIPKPCSKCSHKSYSVNEKDYCLMFNCVKNNYKDFALKQEVDFDLLKQTRDTNVLKIVFQNLPLLQKEAENIQLLLELLSKSKDFAIKAHKELNK